MSEPTTLRMEAVRLGRITMFAPALLVGWFVGVLAVSATTPEIEINASASANGGSPANPLDLVEPTLDRRLKETYEAAVNQGLWKGEYASVNYYERKADLRGKETQKDKSSQDPPLPVPGYQRKTIEGWTLFVSDQLLQRESKATSRALELLGKQLEKIVRGVPAPAVARLRAVPLWFSPAYPGVRPRAEYHPDVGWLRKNGRNPAMAKSIEFTNIRIFAEESRRMPVFVLHELAHAYHDQVLGFDNPEIKAAYRRAVASKSYDAVERSFGNPAKKNTTERAYAMKDAKEYFAETTEALFGRNDFYPFTRVELERHDPEIYRLLRRLWQCDVTSGPRLD